MGDLEQRVKEMREATNATQSEETLTVALQPKQALSGIPLDEAKEFWEARLHDINSLVRKVYGKTHYDKTVSEDVTVHRFITGNTIIGYAHAFRGLVIPDIRIGLFTTSITIKEPVLQAGAAKSLFTELLKEHLFIYNEDSHTAFYNRDCNIIAHDQHALEMIGVETHEACQFVDYDGFNTWEYINLRRPDSGVRLSQSRQYEC